jgi:hypothetical protein
MGFLLEEVTEEELLERVDVLALLAWGSRSTSRDCVAYGRPGPTHPPSY